MQVTQSSINSATVLELNGRLNIQTAGELEKVVDRVISNGSLHLVFACEGLEYCSSAGLRVFLAAVKRLSQSGGKVVFAALSPSVREVLEIAGFLEVMNIQPDIDSAVQ